MSLMYYGSENPPKFSKFSDLVPSALAGFRAVLDEEG